MLILLKAFFYWDLREPARPFVPVLSRTGQILLSYVSLVQKACIILSDEVDAIGGARFDDGAGGDNEVQRTTLELTNQLDGFDPQGNIKVLMVTNRYVMETLLVLASLFIWRLLSPQTRHTGPRS